MCGQETRRVATKCHPGTRDRMWGGRWGGESSAPQGLTSPSMEVKGGVGKAEVPGRWGGVWAKNTGQGGETLSDPPHRPQTPPGGSCTLASELQPETLASWPSLEPTLPPPPPASTHSHLWDCGHFQKSWDPGRPQHWRTAASRWERGLARALPVSFFHLQAALESTPPGACKFICLSYTWQP